MNDSSVHVVIGANYGDEGKGREVDRLTRQSYSAHRPLVVRFNSSAQAGHTVVRDGLRHVFSHFGSGELNAAHTLLAHRFTAVPTVFKREHEQLRQLFGRAPSGVFVEPSIAVATPLDALLNQLQERSRGLWKHGSCGLGFGESVRRREAGFGLTVNDLWSSRSNAVSRSNLIKKLKEHEQYTIEQVMDRVISPDQDEADPLSRVWEALVWGKFNWDPWFEACEFMHENTIWLERDSLGATLSDYKPPIVFESAQGLLLHEGLPEPYSPHVTWARTGCEDAIEFLRDLKIEKPMHLHYCSRFYNTRHGEGPLEGEMTQEELVGQGINAGCETNVLNEHQGALRYGRLNLTNLQARIDRDVRAGRYANSKQEIASISLSVNHCDQIDQKRYPDFRERLKLHLDPMFTTLIFGFGPDSADSEIIENWRATMGAPAPAEAVEPDAGTTVVEPAADTPEVPQEEATEA